MKYRYLTSLSLLSIAIAGHAEAQTGTTATGKKELDIEITIVDENDTPSMVINRITLPPVNSANIATETTTSATQESTLESGALEQELDDITSSTTQAVTESINDALSSGELIDVPKDIGIPDEVIDDLINDTGDAIDDVIGDTATEVNDAIDSLAEDDLTQGLETDLPNAEINSALDDLEATMELETLEAVDDIPGDILPSDALNATEIESSTTQELDSSLSLPSDATNTVEEMSTDALDEAQQELGL